MSKFATTACVAKCECKIMEKKTGGLGQGIRLGIGGSIGRGVNKEGEVNRDRGVNRDRVRAGDEHIIPFEKHPPPRPEKNLTR